MKNTKPGVDSLEIALIKIALEEDLGKPFSDVTTDLLFKNKPVTSTAKIICKHNSPIVLCGTHLIDTLFSMLDAPYQVDFNYSDGDKVNTADIILTLTADAQSLLKLERVLLNFMQHLSGIATLTASYVEAIQHTKAKILDTRKTIPGLRRLAKYAVSTGGGVNHRLGLYDAIMIKDTHSDYLGSLDDALNSLPNDILKNYPVIVEVRNLAELNVVIKNHLHKVSRVLLDNMSVNELKHSVLLCQNKLSTEASGNIDLSNVITVAETGVDFISIGKLTHSATSVDLSMQCTTGRP